MKPFSPLPRSRPKRRRRRSRRPRSARGVGSGEGNGGAGVTGRSDPRHAGSRRLRRPPPSPRSSNGTSAPKLNGRWRLILSRTSCPGGVGPSLRRIRWRGRPERGSPLRPRRPRARLQPSLSRPRRRALPRRPGMTLRRRARPNSLGMPPRSATTVRSCRLPLMRAPGRGLPGAGARGRGGRDIRRRVIPTGPNSSRSTTCSTRGRKCWSRWPRNRSGRRVPGSPAISRFRAATWCTCRRWSISECPARSGRTPNGSG